MIKEEYKEAIITYCEDDNAWRDEESKRCYESLAKAKAAIDRRRRVKNLDFNPVDVFVSKYGGTIRRAVITSVVSPQCVWIRYKDGDKSREKLSFDYGRPPYEMTKENEFLIAEIDALCKNIVALKRTVQEKTEALKKLDMSMLVRDGEDTDA
jgi:hypothetical protein